MFENLKDIEYCDLEEQVEAISNLSGFSKNAVRNILIAQRRHAQTELRLGKAYNIKGIVKILPKEKGDEIVLQGVVSQSVVRPTIIRYINLMESETDKIDKNRISEDYLD